MYVKASLLLLPQQAQLGEPGTLCYQRTVLEIRILIKSQQFYHEVSLALKNSPGFRSSFLRRLVNGSKWNNPEVKMFKDPHNSGGFLKAETLSSGGIFSERQLFSAFLGLPNYLVTSKQGLIAESQLLLMEMISIVMLWNGSSIGNVLTCGCLDGVLIHI